MRCVTAVLIGIVLLCVMLQPLAAQQWERLPLNGGQLDGTVQTPYDENIPRLRIYPNPTNDKLSIYYSDVSEIYTESSKFIRSDIASLNAHDAPDDSLWEPFDVTTIAVQSAAEIGIASVIVGLAYWIVETADPKSFPSGGIALPLFAVWLLPAGAYYAGNWMGGNGTMGGTVLGLISGVALPIGLGAAFPGTKGSVAMWIASIVAGPILGYHISASDTQPSESVLMLRNNFIPLHLHSSDSFACEIIRVRF